MKPAAFAAFLLLAALCSPTFALPPAGFGPEDNGTLVPEAVELCVLKPAIAEGRAGGPCPNTEKRPAPPEGYPRATTVPHYGLAVFLEDDGLCRTGQKDRDYQAEAKICLLQDGPDLSVPEERDGGAKPVLASLDLTSYALNPRAARAVESQITMFTERIRERFSEWLSRSGRYLRLMQRILEEDGIPGEMAFLPLIESGFNPRAYSPRRAAGYWQFIPSTARRYGLQINWWVDERRDPVKSTRAAAAYLKDLHDMFDSWSLAMAAYNAGEAKIMKALRRTRSSDYWGLLTTRYIRRETKNYVPRFIAARLIAADPEGYGFTDLQYREDFAYDEVILEEPLTLDIIAECAGTTPEEIKSLNPELMRWSTPPDAAQYVLRIPQGKREAFLENLSNIPPDRRFGLQTYTVKKGDTVGRISLRTGVPSSVIMSLNNIGRKALISVGQRLYLPTKKSLGSS